jgi:protein phosphatase 1 regulatory subunit 7
MYQPGQYNDRTLYVHQNKIITRDTPLISLDIGLRKLKSPDRSYTRLSNINMSGTVSLDKMEW